MNPSSLKARRFFRISLRGLLVLVTALAVWLGLESKRVRDQRIAVGRVTELGGRIGYEPRGGLFGADAAQIGWPWLRTLVGDDYFQHVGNIGLDKTNVTDADLQFIMARLTKVRTLSLNWTNVSDEGLTRVSTARQIRYLGLKETRVSDAGVKHIAQWRALEGLVLADTVVGDEGIKHLKHLSDLCYVNLTGTSVTSEGIAALTGLKRLTEIYANNTMIDDSAIAHLKKMDDRLTMLLVDGTQFSGQGLLELERSLPSCTVHCEVFSLSGNTRYAEYWTQFVERVYALDDENRVKALDLSHTGLRDTELVSLHGLMNVQIIDLRGTNVSDAACERLKAALPECRVLR